MLVDIQKLIRVWEYLWETYNQDGRVPRSIADAITVVQNSMGASLTVRRIT